MNSSTPNSKRQFNASIPLAEPDGRTIYLRWRIVLTIVLLIILILLSMLAGASQPAEAASTASPSRISINTPKVVAFYYTWFDESSWNSTLSDQPVQGYISRDRGVMRHHIEEAQRSGIDAFIVAWYGPTGQNNQTEPNLSALLGEAAALNFRIGILSESDSPFFSGVNSVSTALNHALQVHTNHPAYLRADDGRPVIFFWRTEAYPVSIWRDVRTQVDPGYGSVWIGDGVDTSYLALFDGHHLYSNTWNPPSDLSYTNQKFANRVTHASNQFGTSKFWVATVMPGYNDVGIRPSQGFAHPRDGGAYFDQSWQAAMASLPTWIVINSFNEWPEGTYIEESVTYGDLYLRKSAFWSQQFKQGGPVNSPTISIGAVADTSQESAANQDPEAANSTFSGTPEGTKVAVSLLNLRHNPNTSSKVVSVLSFGTPVTIIEVQNQWAKIEANGLKGWVFASMLSGLNLDHLRDRPPLQPKALEQNRVRNGDSISGELANEAIYPRFIPYRGPQLGQTVQVDVPILNLRSGPGTNSEVLDELPFGAKLIVEDASPTQPEWIQVRSVAEQGNNNIIVGWVFSSMVK